jgi:hypothetical protein
MVVFVVLDKPKGRKRYQTRFHRNGLAVAVAKQLGLMFDTLILIIINSGLGIQFYNFYNHFVQWTIERNPCLIPLT